MGLYKDEGVGFLASGAVVFDNQDSAKESNDNNHRDPLTTNDEGNQQQEQPFSPKEHINEYIIYFKPIIDPSASQDPPGPTTQWTCKTLWLTNSLLHHIRESSRTSISTPPTRINPTPRNIWPTTRLQKLLTRIHETRETHFDSDDINVINDALFSSTSGCRLGSTHAGFRSLFLDQLRHPELLLRAISVDIEMSRVFRRHLVHALRYLNSTVGAGIDAIHRWEILGAMSDDFGGGGGLNVGIGLGVGNATVHGLSGDRLKARRQSWKSEDDSNGGVLMQFAGGPTRNNVFQVMQIIVRGFWPLPLSKWAILGYFDDERDVGIVDSEDGNDNDGNVDESVGLTSTSEVTDSYAYLVFLRGVLLHDLRERVSEERDLFNARACSRGCRVCEWKLDSLFRYRRGFLVDDAESVNGGSSGGNAGVGGSATLREVVEDSDDGNGLDDDGNQNSSACAIL
ncbi:hypothetical protein HDU76_002066 [Blyttiomyces sp. JEL0837]|nr:hypothetical protein HDU76_002066 [Blyttiomyces sp. JEL0837]